MTTLITAAKETTSRLEGGDLGNENLSGDAFAHAFFLRRGVLRQGGYQR